VGGEAFVVLLPYIRLPLQEDVVERVTVTRVVWHRMDKDIANPHVEYPSGNLRLPEDKERQPQAEEYPRL
jgi:hypothetical protein